MRAGPAGRRAFLGSGTPVPRTVRQEGPSLGSVRSLGLTLSKTMGKTPEGHGDRIHCVWFPDTAVCSLSAPGAWPAASMMRRAALHRAPSTSPLPPTTRDLTATQGQAPLLLVLVPQRPF